jgi:hypothetical protein
VKWIVCKTRSEGISYATSKGLEFGEYKLLTHPSHFQGIVIDDYLDVMFTDKSLVTPVILDLINITVAKARHPAGKKNTDNKEEPLMARNCPCGCGGVTDEKHCKLPACTWYICREDEKMFDITKLSRRINWKPRKTP